MPGPLAILISWLACASARADTEAPDPRLYPLDGEWMLRFETGLGDSLISSFVGRARERVCEGATFQTNHFVYGLRFSADGVVDAVFDGEVDCSAIEHPMWHDETFYATIAWREAVKEEQAPHRLFDVYDVLDHYELQQVGTDNIGPVWRVTPESDESASFRLFDDEAIALLDPGPIRYEP